MNRAAHRVCKGAASCMLLGALIPSLTAAQNPIVLTVDRADATMVITNFGLAADGARTLLNRRGCEEGFIVSVFYGPPDKVRIAIDDETLLRSSLVILREPVEAREESEPERESKAETEGRPEAEAQVAPPETASGAAAAGDDQQTIEMLDGKAAFTDRPACLAEFTPAEKPVVRLEQGRTTVSATRFFLDRETDVAEMSGPVDLIREPEGDSSGLRASADSLAYDLESDNSTLSGNVRVESADRVSEADTLELDEAAGLATLTGDPAVSREGEDRIEGRTLLYYLDSNDVVVIGAVQGTLEVDLE
jgi:lipopolysaccharide export system protein LptA